LPFPPDNSTSDFLLVPMDDFIDKLVLSIDRAEKVLKNPVLQNKDIQIETALHTTVVGGNAILDALRNRSRSTDRQEYGNAKLVTGWSFAQSIEDIVRLMSTQENALNQVVDTSGAELARTPGQWTVKNISKHGLALERMSIEEPKQGVGALIGLHWKAFRGEPLLGFIRWIRYPKAGEQQMGLSFYLRPYVPTHATMLTVGSTDKRRGWPVLFTFEEDGEHTVVFPDTNIFKGLVFSVEDKRCPGYFKVLKVAESGINYSVCTVRLATELDTSNLNAN